MSSATSLPMLVSILGPAFAGIYRFVSARSTFHLLRQILMLVMAILCAALATPAPAQTTSPSPDDNAGPLARAAEGYRKMFDGTIHRFSPDGVHYRDIRANDLARLPKTMNAAIVLMLQMGAEERYDLIDAIKPNALSRIEFMHVLLREGQRRRVLPQVLNDDGYVPHGKLQLPVTVGRPIDIPPGQQLQVKVPAATAAYRDIATQMMKEPMRGSFDLAPDLARQLGVPGARIELPNDMHALIVGYLVGADENLSRTGKLPLAIYYQTEPQAQRQAYCAAASNIASKTGRAVDQNVAMSTGFLMARADAQRSFVGMEAYLSLDGERCPSPPPTWTAMMNQALTGIDDATRGP